MNLKVIAIVGPTAVGKSDLAVKLAQNIPAEIINADAMQLYKGMDIGTAKISEKIRNEIKHHLIDRKSTRLNSSHIPLSRMPSSA